MLYGCQPRRAYARRQEQLDTLAIQRRAVWTTVWLVNIIISTVMLMFALRIGWQQSQRALCSWSPSIAVIVPCRMPDGWC